MIFYLEKFFMYYRIRKDLKGGFTAKSGDKRKGIRAIIFALFRAFSYMRSDLAPSNLSELYNLTKYIPLIPSILFIYLGIKWYKKEKKIDNVKKSKNTGGGIVKKVRITSIEDFDRSGNDNSSGFHGHYVEAREGDMIYCSDAHEGGEKGGTSEVTLKKLYNKYGFEYDKDETHKQDVLREYDKHITEKEIEAENGGFFKKLVVKGGLLLTKGQRETIEKGYEPTYREVNGKRITVGDTVDVFIDPEDENNYWMDIEFLFEE